MTSSSENIVYVNEFVDLVGPETDMLGPVKDGGRIVTGTEPACYGPMITPEVESGHTISRPVAVMGAEVGDAVALKLKRSRLPQKLQRLEQKLLEKEVLLVIHLLQKNVLGAER